MLKQRNSLADFFKVKEYVWSFNTIALLPFKLGLTDHIRLIILSEFQ
jgi:hypothetical protein